MMNKSFIDLQSVSIQLSNSQLDSNLYGSLYTAIKAIYPNNSDVLRKAPLEPALPAVPVVAEPVAAEPAASPAAEPAASPAAEPAASPEPVAASEPASEPVAAASPEPSQ